MITQCKCSILSARARIQAALSMESCQSPVQTKPHADKSIEKFYFSNWTFLSQWCWWVCARIAFFFQLPHARWLKKNRNYLFQNLIFSPSKHSTRSTDVRNEESASSIFYFFVCTILSARRWTRSSVSTRFFLFSFLHLVAKCLTWTPNCRWYERSPIISISLSMFVEPKKICINEVEKSPQQQQQMRKIRCTTIGYDCRAAITKFIAHIMKWRRCYFRPTYE